MIHPMMQRFENLTHQMNQLEMRHIFGDDSDHGASLGNLTHRMNHLGMRHVLENLTQRQEPK